MNTFLKLIISMTLLLAASAAAVGETISVVLPNFSRPILPAKNTLSPKESFSLSAFLCGPKHSPVLNSSLRTAVVIFRSRASSV